MGRINKRAEVALKAAAEMLETTRNQNVKGQLIKIVLNYELRQQERADFNKSERRKRAENKKVAGSGSKLQDPTNQLTSAGSSKDQGLLDPRSKLAEETKRELANVKKDLTVAKQEAEMARKAGAEMQTHLKVIKEVIEQVARSVCAEERYNCASDLFEKLKLDARELLGQLFEWMGLDLKKWYSWDSAYGENDDLMLEALICPEKHEPEKLSLLRLKLSARGIDYSDAIKAVRDYRDLKVGLVELKERAHPHITFVNLESSGLRILNCIPEKHMPCLTEEALRIASQQMQSAPAEKVEWLEVVRKLLKPDSGIGSLLVKELTATSLAADRLSEL